MATGALYASGIDNSVHGSEVADGNKQYEVTPQYELDNQAAVQQEAEEVADDEPVIDIVINNVVCTFGTRCHLNLRQIALNGCNVEYRKEQSMVTMKIRRPSATASIWSSGKLTCTGSTSEEQSHLAARKFARLLQRMGFNVRLTNFRVVNVLGTCAMPFRIKIDSFSREHTQNASYEPEIHPGVTYRIKEPKATLKIFSTGSITVTAPSVLNVQLAIEHIYPLVCEYKSVNQTGVADLRNSRRKKQAQQESHLTPKDMMYFNSDVECDVDSSDEDDFDSEESLD